MENFENIKIIKSCNQSYEREEKTEENCKNLEFGEEKFLDSLDKEILFNDNSIKFQNLSVKSLEANISQQSKEILEVSKQSPLISIQNIAKKLNEQISLPIKNIEDLTFYEFFIVSQNDKETDITNLDIKSSNEIGNACLMIEKLSNGNVLIFAIQQMFINDERTAYESLSIVTKDLELIYEKRIIRKCSDSMFMERIISISPTGNGFKIVKIINKNGDTEYWKSDNEWTKCGNFLSLGAHILMARSLVRENFKGCIQSYICNIDGDFALSQCWFHGSEMTSYHDHELEVKRVDQQLIFSNEKIEKFSFFFSLPNGQLLKQIGNNQEYFIHITPFVDLKEQKYTRNLQNNWKDDIELMSMYLQYKSIRKEELTKRLKSPQMKFLLNEYIRNLIKCKPKSIMNSTVEFMRNLEHNNNVNVQLQIFKTVERRAQQN